MKELKPNIQRGKIAELQIWLLLSVNVALLVLYIIRVILVENLYKKGDYIEELNTVFEIVFNISIFLNLVYLTLIIVSVFTFIRWFRRAYCNLGILTNSCMYDDSWAIKGWFIPFMNLYVPYRIMKELYTKTDEYLLDKYLFTNENYSPTDKLNLNIVKWWWILIIITAMVFSARLLISSISYIYAIDALENTLILTFTMGVYILLAIVTIAVIRNYQKAESLLHNENSNKVEEVENIHI